MKVTLGTTFVFYVTCHAYHWNCEGPFFPVYHALFGKIYTDVWNSIDDMAEQIRQLDAYAPASLERMIALSRINRSNSGMLPTGQMLTGLFEDNDVVIAVLTEALHVAEAEDKQGLVNFLAGRLEAHSKWRWQLRASAKRVG
jgi:starvation-inducible DNA-binding protein